MSATNHPLRLPIMRKTIDKILGYFLAFLMVLMTLDVLWGVITRYALGGQADWSEELARFLLVWIGILGTAYAAGQGNHLAINLIDTKLSAHKRQQLHLFIHASVLVFAFVVMVIGGFRLLYITHTLEQLSAALRVPMALVYAVLPLSGFLIIYYKLLAIQNIRSAGTVSS